MTRAPVQCIALALVCDAARAGNAVAQLVTWRANLGASDTHPNVVKRGASIATLLASIFRDECLATGVRLDHNGVILDLDLPIMSSEVRKQMSNPEFREAKSQDTPVCLVAGDIAGSLISTVCPEFSVSNLQPYRLSSMVSVCDAKSIITSGRRGVIVFAILHLLSEDLQFKVSLADETFNLYKNIRLEPEDETILILCAHYLTLKLNEVWVETNVQSPGLLPHEEHILGEFLDIGKGWSKVIKRQQNDVIELDRKKDSEDENSLYEFLGRVRLNIALDALREVRCVARSADRLRITHTLLQDAVRAHHNRSMFYDSSSPVIRTYRPKLDDQNITGQNLKVQSILPKDKPKPLNFHH